MNNKLRKSVPYNRKYIILIKNEVLTKWLKLCANAELKKNRDIFIL